jgi:hypothetical protein
MSHTAGPIPDAGIRSNLLLRRGDDNIELNRRPRVVSYIGGVANGVATSR